MLQRNKGGPMAKAATPASRRLERKPPKLDLEAVLARYKANPAATRQTRAVLLDVAQAGTTLQAGHAREVITRARDVPVTRKARKPEAVPGEVSAAAETTFATAGQSMGPGVAVQRHAAEPVAARTGAPIERLQALAA
jgi:hypothetical protein